MNQRLEPIVLLLTGLVVFFVLVLLGVAKWMSSDGQTFQAIASLVSGFSGALLMYVKSKAGLPDMPDGSRRTVDANVHTETVVPPKA